MSCAHPQLQLNYSATRRWYIAECQACGRWVGPPLNKRAAANQLAVHLWLAEVKNEVGLDDTQVILGQFELTG